MSKRVIRKNAIAKVAVVQGSHSDVDYYSHSCKDTTEGLVKLGYKVHVVSENNLPKFKLKKHMVMKGTARFVRTGINMMGVKQPANVDIPVSLRKHAHRRVWEATLGEIRRTGDPDSVFIKPLHAQKLFPGGIFSRKAHETYRLPDEFAVLASEVVEMEGEKRFFVANGKIVSEFDPARLWRLSISREQVEKIISDYENPHAGYAIDIAWIKTNDGQEKVGIVELNEVYSAATFGETTPVNLAAALVARWDQIIDQGS